MILTIFRLQFEMSYVFTNINFKSWWCILLGFVMLEELMQEVCSLLQKTGHFYFKNSRCTKQLKNKIQLLCLITWSKGMVLASLAWWRPWQHASAHIPLVWILVLMTRNQSGKNILLLLQTFTIFLPLSMGMTSLGEIICNNHFFIVDRSFCPAQVLQLFSPK